MKVVVVGGTGLIGSKLVAKLGELRHEAVPASPASGVNSMTGEGLTEAFDGAAVVVDVTDAPSFEKDAVREFFETSTRNLLDAEAAVGVGHHVALSVVGTGRLPDSTYLRAKELQEALIEGGAVPYSIVHATQFFEFLGRIADSVTEGGVVRLPPASIQPMSADDVANAVGQVAVGPPLKGILEVAGPERFRFDEIVRRYLEARGDPREVTTDPDARYFGAKLDELSLVPGDEALLANTRFDEWLDQAPTQTR
jgi:uncharacterized protein YbjT (DUF2867 family)